MFDHVTIRVSDRPASERFCDTVLAAIGIEGPGERAIYRPGYRGAFVLDPSGNNVGLVNHNG